ncbi:MAG: hypothetical protein AB7S51_09615 [Porticoccaceae bacterium]
MHNTMHKLAANWKSALAAALLAGIALTAWGITFNLNDGTTSINCATTGTTTIDPSGNINASVQPGCIPTGGGDPPPPGSFTLTVTKTGSGSGTVSSNPAGINNCSATCNASFTDGTSVTLTVSPAGGSTFGGWTGACTGSGSCNPIMTADRTVFAAFNTSGGGGGDPGSGLWINGSNFVHDRGALTELYVPRCVPSQYNNCRAGGQLSQYDTLVAGQVWAMRIPVGALGNTTYSFGVERAETGESLNAYDFAVSTVPGDFNVSSKCKQSGTGVVRVHKVGYTPPFGISSCQVNLNALYYLNVRPQAGTPAATDCGIGSGNACRYRITLPSGFTYQP